MGTLSKVLRGAEGHRVMYWCQGCDQLHMIKHADGGPHTWDGNVERPTFSPSVLYDRIANGQRQVCHTFVRDGMVQFLDDCTHAFAGQTVPLPDLPDWLQD